MDRQERDAIIEVADAISATAMCFGADSKETELAIKRLYNHLGDIVEEKDCKYCSCQGERIYDV